MVEYELDESSKRDKLCSTSLTTFSALAEKCRGAMDSAVASGIARSGISVTQRQVFEELQNLQYDPTKEFVDVSTGYSIDAVVVMAGAGDAAGCGKVPLRSTSAVAVEVDGPSHFAHNITAHVDSSDRAGLMDLAFPCGGTAMKRRHLSRCGYFVVAVPYWEWDSLNDDDEAAQREARQKYLRAKISKAFSRT